MKIICIGRNYSEHIRELNNEVPEEPVIFIKPDTALLRNNNPFYIPDFSQDVHHEVEIVVKINKPGRAIPVQFARDYYTHISLGIDFTARDLQTQLKTKGLPWEKAKGFDHSAAVGDFFPLEDFSSPISQLSFQLQKNNQEVQNGNTQCMIHGVDEIIAYVSNFFSLRIGDYIFTGTPAGVGPVASGDILKGFIEDKEILNFKILG